MSLDVESELREAMSDTVQKTADGEYPSFFLPFIACVVNALCFSHSLDRIGLNARYYMNISGKHCTTFLL